MELRTSVRAGVRSDCIEAYLDASSSVESVWAWQIGEAIPRPWCSGAWGLWAGNCFEGFVCLVHLAVEMTSDAWMAQTCRTLWHFLDALRYVCQPLYFDHVPAIAAIDRDREMNLAGATLRDVCRTIQEAGCDAEQSYIETGAIALRQVAKHRLRDASADLAPLFYLAWSPVEDPKYSKYYANEESRRAVDPDIVERIRVPAEPGVDYPMDQFVDIHLISARERARHGGGDVCTRAELILHDLQLWVALVFQRFGGDTDELKAIEAEKFMGNLFELLARDQSTSPMPQQTSGKSDAH